MKTFKEYIMESENNPEVLQELIKAEKELLKATDKDEIIVLKNKIKTLTSNVKN